MTTPKTYNLNPATRKEVIQAGRNAATHGYSMRQCPWAAQHGPVSKDDPRLAEIIDLWQWAHGGETRGAR